MSNENRRMSSRVTRESEDSASNEAVFNVLRPFSVDTVSSLTSNASYYSAVQTASESINTKEKSGGDVANDEDFNDEMSLVEGEYWEEGPGEVTIVEDEFDDQMGYGGGTVPATNSYGGEQSVEVELGEETETMEEPGEGEEPPAEGEAPPEGEGEGEVSLLIITVRLQSTNRFIMALECCYCRNRRLQKQRPVLI